MFNRNHAYLAVDGDPTTCAVTGLETTGPWWKIDLGSRMTVTGVRLVGEKPQVPQQYATNVNYTQVLLCLC